MHHSIGRLVRERKIYFSWKYIWHTAINILAESRRYLVSGRICDGDRIKHWRCVLINDAGNRMGIKFVHSGKKIVGWCCTDCMDGDFITAITQCWRPLDRWNSSIPNTLFRQWMAYFKLTSKSQNRLNGVLESDCVTLCVSCLVPRIGSSLAVQKFNGLKSAASRPLIRRIGIHDRNSCCLRRWPEIRESEHVNHGKTTCDQTKRGTKSTSDRKQLVGIHEAAPWSSMTQQWHLWRDLWFWHRHRSRYLGEHNNDFTNIIITNVCIDCWSIAVHKELTSSGQCACLIECDWDIEPIWLIAVDLLKSDWLQPECINQVIKIQPVHWE